MNAHRKVLDFLRVRREAGLSDETTSILMHLHGNPAARASDIALACEINPTSLPRYLSALVNLGHVQKQAAQDDGRERLFLLSEHGTRLVNSLLKHFSCAT